MGDASYITLSLPVAVTGQLAGQLTGLPADELRFESMAPVSTAARDTFAATARLLHAQLMVPGQDQVHPRIAQELTRLTAAATLEQATVIAVSLRCGFPSASRFAAYYRKAYGVTPTQTLHHR